MVEYIVRTDKPIRLDAVLHLHGIHHYAVQRLKEHGRLVDAEELCKNFTGECWENLYAYVAEAPTVLEAST